MNSNYPLLLDWFLILFLSFFESNFEFFFWLFFGHNFHDFLSFLWLDFYKNSLFFFSKRCHQKMIFYSKKNLCFIMINFNLLRFKLTVFLRPLLKILRVFSRLMMKIFCWFFSLFLALVLVLFWEKISLQIWKNILRFLFLLRTFFRVSYGNLIFLRAKNYLG